MVLVGLRQKEGVQRGPPQQEKAPHRQNNQRPAVPGLQLLSGVFYIFVLGRFEYLADAFVTAMVPFYGLSVAALFVLRGRPDFKPSFRTPLYPILPLLFVAASIFLLANALIDEGQRNLTLMVLGIILAGIPVYYVMANRRIGRSDD
jgi:L-asparagine transporter-like permease